MAPDKIALPVLLFTVKPPVPLNTPLKVVRLVLVIILLPVKVPFPDKVKLLEPPMVPLLALTVIGFDRLIVPPAVCCKVPPLNAKVLVPKAELLLAVSVPEVKVVVPE